MFGVLVPDFAPDADQQLMRARRHRLAKRALYGIDLSFLVDVKSCNAPQSIKLV